MTEKFNLKWNDFQTNVSISFRLFREESYLHDVTLVSEDLKHIPAHKLVLSASSEYFKNMLKETKQSQPLICLDGINSVDIQNVLDYVYDGEVNIQQDNLDRFLFIAQRLKLEGLTGSHEQEDKESEPKSDFNLFKEGNQEDTKIIVKVKQDLQLPAKKKPSFGVDSVRAVNEFQEREMLDEKILINQNGVITCTDCGKAAPNIRDMRNHVETHIEGLAYPCKVCGKEYRSNNSLQKHKSTYHR